MKKWYNVNSWQKGGKSGHSHSTGRKPDKTGLLLLLFELFEGSLTHDTVSPGKLGSELSAATVKTFVFGQLQLFIIHPFHNVFRFLFRKSSTLISALMRCRTSDAQKAAVKPLFQPQFDVLTFAESDVRPTVGC